MTDPDILYGTQQGLIAAREMLMQRDATIIDLRGQVGLMQRRIDEQDKRIAELTPPAAEAPAS